MFPIMRQYNTSDRGLIMEPDHLGLNLCLTLCTCNLGQINCALVSLCKMGKTVLTRFLSKLCEVLRMPHNILTAI